MIGNTSFKRTGIAGFAGWQRHEYNPGEAEVLVVDFMDFSWGSYESAVPLERKLLLVHDTTAAEQAMRENPHLRVVIVQGLSRRVHNRMVDKQLIQRGASGLSSWMIQQMQAGQPVDDWIDEFAHTLSFVQKLAEGSFNGPVFVVSRMLTAGYRSALDQVKNLNVQPMHKDEFFDRARQLLTDDLFASSSAHSQLWDAWDRLLCSKDPAAEGAQMALEVLDEFEKTVLKGDPAEIFGHLVQIVDDTRGYCACRDEDCRSTPCDKWFHDHHGLLNQAIWDLLNASGLTGWVRLELERDMAGPDHFFEDDSRPWGEVVLKEFGLHLRSYLKFEGPYPEWFGPTINPA